MVWCTIAGIGTCVLGTLAKINNKELDCQSIGKSISVTFVGCTTLARPTSRGRRVHGFSGSYSGDAHLIVHDEEPAGKDDRPPRE